VYHVNKNKNIQKLGMLTYTMRVKIKMVVERSQCWGGGVN